MSTNGSVEVAPPAPLMDELKWGDVRRYQKLLASDAEAAAEYFNTLLNRVYPGLDEMPFFQAAAAVKRFNRLLEDGASGKDLSTAPSSQDSGAVASDTTAM